MTADRLLTRGAVILWITAVFVFLFAPLVVIVGASFGGGTDYSDTANPITRLYVNFPPDQLSLYWYRRIPFEHFRALGISVLVALGSALGAALLGIPAALGIARAQFPGKPLVEAIFRVPLQIPSVVIGVAFLRLYYYVADFTGLHLIGTLPGLILAHVFLTTPYVVGTVTAVLLRFNRRLEEAALSLGATRLRTLWRVTLPVIMPGAYTGVLYAFMVSFADVPVSVFLASGSYTTYPVEIFFAMELDFNPAILASATLVMVGSLLVLLLIQRAVGLDALLRSGGRG